MPKKNLRKGPSGPKLRIQVEERHVRDSIRKDSSHCMTAEAIKDALPDARFISVDLQSIRMSFPKQGRRYLYLTPRRVQEALATFDMGGKVAPFAFTLENAAQVIEYGGSQRRPIEPVNIDEVNVSQSADSTVVKGDSSVGGNLTITSKGRRGNRSEVVREDRKRVRSNGGRSIPTTVGGTFPPNSALSNARGRRRRYGVRSLEKMATFSDDPQ